MVILQSAKRTLKYSAIRAVLEAVALSRAHSLFRLAGDRGVIFTLHHVRPERRKKKLSPHVILSVTPEFLEEAILTARDNGLTPVHLHDLPSLLSDPSDRRRFVAFTLDDGYRNNAEFAAPVFRKHDIPYTIFVTPGFVRRERTMWWETAVTLTREVPSFRFDFGDGPQVVNTASTARKVAAFERMAALVESIDEDEAVQRIDEAARAAGIDPTAIVDRLIMDEAELRELAKDPLVHFGAHTLTHVNLRRVSAERLKAEIYGSAEALADFVGYRPRSFAYPYGRPSAVGRRETLAVAEAGFAAAVTTQPGILRSACADRPTELPRISLNGYYQKRRYVEALISGLPALWMETARRQLAGRRET